MLLLRYGKCAHCPPVNTMFTKRADLMSPTCVTVWYTVWYIHPLTAPPGYVVTEQEAYFREHKTRKKQINIDSYIGAIYHYQAW